MYRNLVTKIKLAILKLIVAYFPGLVRAIESRASSDISHVRVIEHSLLYSRQPIHTLNFLMGESGYPLKYFWVVIDRFSSEQSDIWKSLCDECSLVHSKEMLLYIKLKDCLNRKVSFDVNCNLLIEQYLSLKNDDVYRSNKIVGLLSTVVLLNAPLNDVEEMLGLFGGSIKNLTEFQKLKFLSRFRDIDFPMFESWYQKLKRDFSHAGLIKVALIRASLAPCQADIYRELEDGFLSLPHSISHIYRKELKPGFDALSDEKNYINAKFDQKKIRKVQKIVVDRLRSRSPLSYIRLGDGECYGFVDYQNVDERGEVRQEKHWWGTELDAPIRSKLKEEFLSAVKKSDILGVPTVLRLIKDFNIEFKGEYPTNSLLARLVCVMKSVGPFLPNKIVVEDQSNLYLFNDTFMEHLFRSADKIVVISGIKSEFVRRWASNDPKLICVEIPTHRLLRDGVIGSNIDGILPFEYERYFNIISKNAAPGVLFLVSAGFIGKSFVSKAAEHGAVALDIGQALATEIGSRWGRA
ncbi:GT-D fold domain-containing protein [Marinobacter gudaonensis]|nr:hypothetical protein [Marinobacter gudaonensis]